MMVFNFILGVYFFLREKYVNKKYVYVIDKREKVYYIGS